MDPTIEVIDTQLDAMQRWTANGREPAADERKTISVGVIAARNLDAEGDGRRGSRAGSSPPLANFWNGGRPTRRPRTRRTPTTGRGSG